MPTAAQEKLEAANKKVADIKAERAAVKKELKDVYKKIFLNQHKIAKLKEKIEAEEMEKDAGPPGLSLAEYRKTPKGQREYEAWANRKAPKDGKPDFGGRHRTRRGRKSRGTRRR
jgi:chromosome segregation ATPase